jgi:hypothetical protein
MAARCRRDVSLLALMDEEVATNLAVLELNDDLMVRELAGVDSGAVLLDALIEIQLGAWESIRDNLTRWLPDHTNLFAQFRPMSISGAQMNQLARNRELYRTQGTASNAYPIRMREYDEGIREKIARVRGHLNDLQNQLRALEKTVDPKGRRGQ